MTEIMPGFHQKCRREKGCQKKFCSDTSVFLLNNTLMLVEFQCLASFCCQFGCQWLAIIFGRQLATNNMEREAPEFVLNRRVFGARVSPVDKHTLLNSSNHNGHF